jgi:hypothetical protein
VGHVPSALLVPKGGCPPPLIFAGSVILRTGHNTHDPQAVQPSWYAAASAWTTLVVLASFFRQARQAAVPMRAYLNVHPQMPSMLKCNPDTDLRA